jgi:ABC-type glycerol-3-phosphate transport system substrate-binding protein
VSATSSGGTTQAASASAVASTAATSSAAPVSSAAAKPATNGITVTWWSGWGSSEQNAFAPVAAAANQAGLGFTSVQVAQSDAATKHATTIAAGTPPDMEVGNLAYPEFWASGSAIPLDSYLATSTIVKKADLLDSEGFLGARKSFLTKIDPKQYPGLDWYLRSPTGAKELWANPVDPIEGLFADNWATTRTKVLQGTLTPKDALGQLQQVATAQLAQQLGKG